MKKDDSNHAQQQSRIHRRDSHIDHLWARLVARRRQGSNSPRVDGTTAATELQANDEHYKLSFMLQTAIDMSNNSLVEDANAATSAVTERTTINATTRPSNGTGSDADKEKKGEGSTN